MELIGIHGFANSGKSTAAEYFVTHHGFTRMSFAAAVKDVTCAVFGWDRIKIEGNTPENRAWREVPDPFWTNLLGRNITPRIALQFLGTELFRNNLHTDIWANILIARVRALGPDAKVVVDDCRFVNERAVLKANGGRLLIVRGKEFPSPIHQRLWEMGMCNEWIDEGIEDIHPDHFVDAAKGLHPSEWDWLKDPTVVSDTVIINDGTSNFLSEIESWYTATR